VYAGIDPITKREIRLKATAKTEQQAHIELGRLLKETSEGRTPESDATVAKLLDEYAAIAPWDVSTRQTNEGFIRRPIKPALGHLEVWKVRGPARRAAHPCCRRGRAHRRGPRRARDQGRVCGPRRARAQVQPGPTREVQGQYDVEMEL
jgi:hypothetical protein